jgi:hypothetical protein
VPFFIEISTEFIISVAPKSDLHPHASKGFPFGYLVNGNQAPELTLTRGVTYRFIVTGIKNNSRISLLKQNFYFVASCSHRFYISSSESGNGLGIIEEEVVNSGACKVAKFFLQDGDHLMKGEVLEFTPSENHPDVGLYYQCLYHDYMGAPITIVSSNGISKGAPMFWGIIIAVLALLLNH